MEEGEWTLKGQRGRRFGNELRLKPRPTRARHPDFPLRPIVQDNQTNETQLDTIDYSTSGNHQQAHRHRQIKPRPAEEMLMESQGKASEAGKEASSGDARLISEFSFPPVLLVRDRQPRFPGGFMPNGSHTLISSPNP